MASNKEIPTFQESSVIPRKVVTRSVTLTLPNAYPRQWDFITAHDRLPGVRFVVAACGTKAGKTFGCSIAMIRRAWNYPNTTNWWVAPTYLQSSYAMGVVKSMLPKGTYREYKADLMLAILEPSGKERSHISFKSADNPDNLRGFGVHFFVMDEAARCSDDAHTSLITTVTQTRGKGFLISTPFGRGRFYEEYLKGVKYDDEGNYLFQDTEDPFPEYYSVRLPTWANPHVQLDSVKEMKRTLPEDMFRQEVEAQFLLDSAGVFRGIPNCIKGSLQPPRRGGRYVMGVDLARLKDFSVITVVDTNDNHVVYFDRFNQLSWEVQYQRIIEVARKYRARVCMDSTGIGDPIVEAISRAGISVTPYKIHSPNTKKQLIDKLRVKIEHGDITFPRIPIMIRELEAYEYELGNNGLIKFSAPSGLHDDCVISLALANWLIDEDPFVYKFTNRRGI